MLFSSRATAIIGEICILPWENVMRMKKKLYAFCKAIKQMHEDSPENMRSETYFLIPIQITGKAVQLKQ